MQILPGDDNRGVAGEREQPLVQRLHQVAAELLRRGEVVGLQAEEGGDQRVGAAWCSGQPGAQSLLLLRRLVSLPDAQRAPDHVSDWAESGVHTQRRAAQVEPAVLLSLERA